MSPKSRVRVLLASRIYLPEAAAASFRLGAVVRALSGAGAQVEVLTAAVPARLVTQGAQEQRSTGQRVTEASHDLAQGGELNIRRWPVLRDAAGYVRGYLPYLSFDVPLAVRLLLARRPDVVLVEPPPTTGAVVRAVTTLTSLVRRVPYVYYAADIWSDASAATGASRAVVEALRALERFSLRGAARVIAVSDGVASRARELGAQRVTVVPNGIDTDIFTPEGEGPEQAPAGPFLLYAGTASEWQGAEIFAEAMERVIAQVPGARLVFLGQGSSWPALAALAAQLPVGTIELRPLVPPEEAAQWHRAAAAALVSVKPGVDYDFAYPTKVLAALACGTAVIHAGPGPAGADIAAHDLGLAVPYESDAVAAAMVAALRAGGSEGDVERRVAWVREHRSLAATGEAVAQILAREAERPGG